jgi:predicted ABC-type exoprotein transport system permease subunit
MSFTEIVESVLGVFFLLQWQLPILPVVCVVLGVLTARKSHRSVFNWVLVGLLAGLIPVVGPILMVVAYLWYPPPPPTTRPGYHPPKTTREHARSGERRSRDPR